MSLVLGGYKSGTGSVRIAESARLGEAELPRLLVQIWPAPHSLWPNVFATAARAGATLGAKFKIERFKCNNIIMLGIEIESSSGTISSLAAMNSPLMG